MHIGVDIDSVIAEIVHPLFQFHNDVYYTRVKKHQHTRYDLSPTWQVSQEEVLKRVYEFYASPYFDLVKPVKGAKKGIQYLSKRHKLSAITSRPYHIEQKTIRWLDMHFPKQFSAIRHTNWFSSPNAPKKKKSEICLEIEIELLIDDHLDFAYDVASIGIPVLLFNQPWNQTNTLPKGIRRVHSWKEIIKLLG